MECRLRASPDQFLTLLKFMETHGDLGRPMPGCHGRINSARLWLQLGKLLNSSAGGVVKPIDKWKKVWADWKAKTKKKALQIRREGPGDGTGKKLNLTVAEKRVLGVMGIKVLAGPVKTEKQVPEEPIIKQDPLSPTRDDPDHSEFPSYTATNHVVLDFVPIYSMENSSTTRPPSPEQSRSPSPREPKPPLARVTTPVQPPNATVSRKVVRRWRPVTRSHMAPTLRRQRLIRAQERAQTRFQQCTNEFTSIEATRLQLEVEREKNNHQKEMERLRLESRRIEMEENRNQTLNRLVNVLDKLTEILPQLRPSSLR